MGDIRNAMELFGTDLIIDATGIEALSEALNDRHCTSERNVQTPPVLYVWVLGNGVRRFRVFGWIPRSSVATDVSDYRGEFSIVRSDSRS